MSLIANSKQGDCSRCDSKNTPCRKRGKNLLCLSCCRTEDVEKQLAKQKDKAKLQRTLSSLKSIPENIEAVRVEKGKSELLAQADKLFGDYIKNRDKDKNGQAKCPCCGKDVLVEVNGKFNPDCNVMHFIDRDVYSLRYDEDFAAAGHSWCNRNQHYKPNGVEYQNFKKHLVDKLGADAVHEAEVAKRKINKISAEQLKVVIELYSDKSLHTV